MTHYEFSRPFPADRVGHAETIETIEANEQERVLLARRFNLVAIDKLTAVLRLRREAATGLIQVRGAFEADVTQTCSISNEAFSEHIAEPIDDDFTENPVEEEEFHGEIELTLEHIPPEPILDGVIDLGEVTAQFLSLSLDPYPRAPGVALDAVWHDPEGGALSPFAALRALKKQP